MVRQVRYVKQMEYNGKLIVARLLDYEQRQSPRYTAESRMKGRQRQSPRDTAESKMKGRMTKERSDRDRCKQYGAYLPYHISNGRDSGGKQYIP
jgi:hypothetical protein